MKISNLTASQQNTSFGVNLKFAQDIPAFVQKEAMNKALRIGKSVEQAQERCMHFLKEDLVQITEKAKYVEPYDLEMRVDLTDAARKYTQDLTINGQGFEGTPTQIAAFPPNSEFGIGALLPSTPSSYYYFNDYLPQIILKLAELCKSRM